MGLVGIVRSMPTCRSNRAPSTRSTLPDAPPPIRFARLPSPRLARSMLKGNDSVNVEAKDRSMRRAWPSRDSATAAGSAPNALAINCFTTCSVWPGLLLKASIFWASLSASANRSFALRLISGSF